MSTQVTWNEQVCNPFCSFPQILCLFVYKMISPVAFVAKKLHLQTARMGGQKVGWLLGFLYAVY